MASRLPLLLLLLLLPSRAVHLHYRPRLHHTVGDSAACRVATGLRGGADTRRSCRSLSLGSLPFHLSRFNLGPSRT
jgi:hypothetical protein